MKACPRCDKEISNEDKFCGFCGYNLLMEKAGSSFTQQELKVSDIRLNLGIVYLKQGKFEMAIENFEKVLELDPENLSVKKMLEKAQSAQSIIQ
jgi:Tfp pilus assembly protein PilF